MARKQRRRKKSKKNRSRGVAPEAKTASSPESPWRPRPGRSAWVWGVFAWGLLAQVIFFQHGTSVLLFFGDGLYYLQKARHLAEGTSLDAGLPYHPPLPGWILTPLWWILPGDAVAVASKAVMALFNAATYAVVYLLLSRPAAAGEARPRVAHPALFCLFLPLSFGELQLSAAPNNEAIYRLLLVALIWLEFRWPLVGGVLHGLAALTRAEHVVLGLGLLALGLYFRERRRFAMITAGVAIAVLVPYAGAVSADLRAYNAEHAETLPESLPTVVPVSFYGPLNFALAHTEDDIFFSRRNLPPSQGDATLDPNHPIHNDYIVHGYRIGLETIWKDPGRFVTRSLRKLGHSLRAFAFGWTWRDLPKGEEWTRQPIDMASASAPFYEVVVALLIVLGAWHLRRDRWLLGLGLALVAYRLAINVAFFPYLRSMMIAAPFTLLLAFAGCQVLLRRFTPKVLGAVLVLLALFHTVTGLTAERRYFGKGERDARGQIIDDRPVILMYKDGSD